MAVNRDALTAAFTPAVFATDRALEMVGEGVPFRRAYQHVKEHLDELRCADPREAALKKRHLGAPGGLDFDELRSRLAAGREFVSEERREYHRAVSRLLGVRYPLSD